MYFFIDKLKGKADKNSMVLEFPSSILTSGLISLFQQFKWVLDKIKIWRKI